MCVPDDVGLSQKCVVCTNKIPKQPSSGTTLKSEILESQKCLRAIKPKEKNRIAKKWAMVTNVLV